MATKKTATKKSPAKKTATKSSLQVTSFSFEEAMIHLASLNKEGGNIGLRFIPTDDAGSRARFEVLNVSSDGYCWMYSDIMVLGKGKTSVEAVEYALRAAGVESKVSVDETFDAAFIGLTDKFVEHRNDEELSNHSLDMFLTLINDSFRVSAINRNDRMLVINRDHKPLYLKALDAIQEDSIQNVF
jgi:hypothetical protein